MLGCHDLARALAHPRNETDARLLRMVYLVRRSACARSSTMENLKRMKFLRRRFFPKYLFQSVMSPVDMNLMIRFRELRSKITYRSGRSLCVVVLLPA